MIEIKRDARGSPCLIAGHNESSRLNGLDGLGAVHCRAAGEPKDAGSDGRKKEYPCTGNYENKLFIRSTLDSRNKFASPTMTTVLCHALLRNFVNDEVPGTFQRGPHPAKFLHHGVGVVRQVMFDRQTGLFAVSRVGIHTSLKLQSLCQISNTRRRLIHHPDF